MTLGLLLGTLLCMLGTGFFVAAETALISADRVFLETQKLMAQFYAEQVMPRAFAFGTAVRTGSRSTMALAAENF